MSTNVILQLALVRNILRFIWWFRIARNGTPDRALSPLAFCTAARYIGRTCAHLYFTAESADNVGVTESFQWEGSSFDVLATVCVILRLHRDRISNTRDRGRYCTCAYRSSPRRRRASIFYLILIASLPSRRTAYQREARFRFGAFFHIAPDDRKEIVWHWGKCNSFLAQFCRFNPSPNLFC